MPNMKKYLFLLFSVNSLFLGAQKNTVVAVPAAEMPIAGVQTTITKGSVTIAGKKIDYTAHTGYLDLENDTGKLLAKVFFTYYRKEGESDAKRPVTFTFNGGPGSSSVWLHMGALGPRRVYL